MHTLNILYLDMSHKVSFNTKYAFKIKCCVMFIVSKDIFISSLTYYYINMIYIIWRRGNQNNL